VKTRAAPVSLLPGHFPKRANSTRRSASGVAGVPFDFVA
jgi:hypothetical protein